VEESFDLDMIVENGEKKYLLCDYDQTYNP
jgi:hypothetical protein